MMPPIAVILVKTGSSGDANARALSVAPFEIVGNNKTMHTRPCTHPVHEIPIHGVRDWFENLGWNMVAVRLKVTGGFFGQMP